MDQLVQMHEKCRVLLSDYGVCLTSTLEEGIQQAQHNDKLLLVYMQDMLLKLENDFTKILLNNDVNTLFKSDFIIHMSTAEEIDDQFYGFINVMPSDVKNKLFVFSVQAECVVCVSTINLIDKPLENLLFHLHLINETFQNELRSKYGELVEQCSKLYMEKFKGMNVAAYHSLEKALKITIMHPLVYMRKILVIFMYNIGKSNDLIKLFLRLSINRKYYKFFIPVIWDISDTKYHKALIRACKLHFEQDLLEETITNGDGGLFFFLPETVNTPSVPRIFSCILSSRNLDISLEKCDGIIEYFQRTFKITELYEIEAIEDYQIRHPITFQNYMHCSSLHDITQMCFQPQPKMLFLYFYTSTSKLQKALPKIKNIMFESELIFLPWDINESVRNDYLALSLQRAFGLQKIEIILRSKTSALFIFVPIGNTLVLHSVLQDNAEVSEIKRVYTDAHRFFMLESKMGLTENNDSGPGAYQQVMCKQLENRDFDGFQLEKNEHIQLKQKVAFAYFDLPGNEDGEYTASQMKQIQPIYKKLLCEASKYGKNEVTLAISFMRVCITPLPEEKEEKLHSDSAYQPTLDYTLFPLFGIQKCFDCPPNSTPCRIYIDHIGRIYETWEDFLYGNKYPKAMLIAPKNGKYSRDYHGNVQLEICPTPACGIGVAVLKGFDIGASIAGSIAGVVAIATTSVATAPAIPFVAMGTGIGVGMYSIVRSGMAIADRKKYGESVGLKSAEAREAYLNIIAGSLGFTYAGATFALAYMARAGMNVGLPMRALVNSITIANISASCTAIGNTGHHLILEWKQSGRMNTLALVQFTSAVLFFGHAVYNVQSASTIIRNSQNNVISEVLDSLSENSPCHSLLSMLNAANNMEGSSASGKAQIIRFIRNFDNGQEVGNFLTRNSQLFNRKGITFSAEKGEICFNGTKMTMSDFNSWSQPPGREFLLPSTKLVTGATTVVRTNNIVKIVEIVQILAPVFKTLIDPKIEMQEKMRTLLSEFTPYVQNQLVMVLRNFMQKIGRDENVLYLSIADLFPMVQIPLQVMRMIVKFYKAEAITWQMSKSNRVVANAIVNIMEETIIKSTCSMVQVLEKLIQFCSKWIMSLRIKKEMEAVKAPVNRRLHRCDKCRGQFYKS